MASRAPFPVPRPTVSASNSASTAAIDNEAGARRSVSARHTRDAAAGMAAKSMNASLMLVRERETGTGTRWSFLTR